MNFQQLVNNILENLSKIIKIQRQITEKGPALLNQICLIEYLRPEYTFSHRHIHKDTYRKIHTHAFDFTIRIIKVKNPNISECLFFNFLIM